MGQRATPLDDLVLARVGHLSDVEVRRRTGLARDTLRGIRCGVAPRAHVVRRLADGLGLAYDEVADAVVATVLVARAPRTGSAA